MLLDIGADRISQQALNPLPTTPRDFWDTLSMSYEADRSTQSSDSRFRAEWAAYERAADDLQKRFGPMGANPAADPVENAGSVYAGNAPGGQVREAWQKRIEQLQAERPDEANDLARFMPDAIEQGARERAVGAQRDYETVQSVQGMSMAGTIGGAGAMARDPLNIVTAPIGAGSGGSTTLGLSILRAALIEAGVGAGTSLAIDASAAPFRVQSGLPAGVGENLLMGALGGAVIGGGSRALVEGWRAFRGRAPAADGGVALRENDAATVLEAQSRDMAGNPGGPPAAEAHLELLDRATEAVSAGRLAPEGMPVREAFTRALLDPDVEPARSLSEPDGPYQVSRDGAAREGDLPDHGLYLSSDADGGYRFPPGSAVQRYTAEPQNALRVEVPEDVRRIGARGDFTAGTEAARRFLGDAEVDRLLGLSPEEARAEAGRHGVTLPEGRRENLRLVEILGAKQARAAGHDAIIMPHRTSANEPPEMVALTRGILRSRDPRQSFRIHTPAGRSITAEAQVVELRDLIPSHTDEMTPNPAYPHAEGVQPRDRSRDASQAQVQDIAANLEPERLRPATEAGSGAPIIDAENVVESGNGRVLAIRRAYSDPSLAGRVAAYRDMLEAQGHDVAGMSQPVLVSRRVSALSPDERRAFVREANSSTALTMGAAERARLDADLAGRALDLYRGGDIPLADNAPFVRAFMQGVPQAERGAMQAGDGTLSGEGARRIRGAVLARAYGDEMGPLLDRILEGDAEGLRSIAGALQDVSGPWAGMRAAAARGELAPGMDVTADLLAAVRTVTLAREKRIPVADLIAQTDLDAPALTDAGRALLASMYRDNGFRSAAGRASVSERLGGYVDEAMKTRPEPDLFGTAPPAAREVLDATDPMRGRQVAAVDTARRTAEIQAEPKAQDADFLEAQRIAGARDLAIPVDDAGGTRGLRELLDEAEEAVADAAGAAACFVGAGVSAAA